MSDQSRYTDDQPEVVSGGAQSSNRPAEERSLLQSTVIRFVLGLFVLVVVAIAVIAVAFLAYRSSRNKPLKVKLYPGAVLVNSETVYNGFDHQQYTSTDSMEQIEAFYDKQKNMTCERQYQQVVARPGQDPLREGHIYTRCQIDRSGFGMTQYTTVTIQPVTDQNQQPTGQVMIDVQRYWDN